MITFLKNIFAPRTEHWLRFICNECTILCDGVPPANVQPVYRACDICRRTINCTPAKLVKVDRTKAIKRASKISAKINMGLKDCY